ncbi:MAG: Sapep family Mn(2+)-dependent dipeptidase [Erysipelotrichales bacterium]
MENLLLEIENSQDEILSVAKRLISIPSVKEESNDAKMPFGKPCNDALMEAFKICEEYNLKTTNLDGYAGYAEIGQGEEMVAILCHLDVVPVEGEWQYEPFNTTIVNDLLYGRGTLDDKGPAAVSIVLLKLIQESNISLNRRIRLIFGVDEESGSEDIKYYREHAEIPVAGFTPDADFPVIRGEKGILQVEVRVPQDNITDIKSGSSINSVPDHATITIDGKTFEANGKAAHGSTPEAGINALAVLIDKLYNEGYSNGLIDFYKQYIDITGAKLEIDLSDVDGALSLNQGLVKLDDGFIKLYLDIRYPITYQSNDVLDVLNEKLDKETFTILTIADPISFASDNRMVNIMLNNYNKFADTPGDATVIGGGTYARSLDNIVAFGPLMPNREDMCHQKDEYMHISDLMIGAKIYAKTIIELANEF